MRTLTRSGWTLHEMMISLCVMAVAAGLAAHAAVVQLRFFRGAGEIVAVRGQNTGVGAMIAASAWGIAPSGGDVQFASDSALEVRTAIGSAVACGGAPSMVTVPAPEASGNTLTGFDALPDAGDIIDAYIADSLGAGWIRATAVATAVGSGPCLAFPQARGTLAITMREPLSLPAGAILRFSRPIRFSHYRASDGQWYFGARDWSSTSLHLNTVQPVAGPLEPHSSDTSKSGLVFRYFDAAGAELPAPTNPSMIATISVTARGRSRMPVSFSGRTQNGTTLLDSAVTVVALRNVR